MSNNTVNTKRRWSHQPSCSTSSLVSTGMGKRSRSVRWATVSCTWRTLSRWAGPTSRRGRSTGLPTAGACRRRRADGRRRRRRTSDRAARTDRRTRRRTRAFRCRTMTRARSGEPCEPDKYKNHFSSMNKSFNMRCTLHNTRLTAFVRDYPGKINLDVTEATDSEWQWH